MNIGAGKLEIPPPDIRRRGKDLIRVLTNENRALLLANEMNLHFVACHCQAGGGVAIVVGISLL